ncbi:MAG TPA: TlyA family RNA methyltransferase [Candidatus Saccharimonadales bacterium]|nr:TlyA family RNA methyltransferase [Candidatus Saccharimonadales bacterium]
MDKQRLDQALVEVGLVSTRSQAESYIKLGYVTVNNRIITKPGYSVQPNDVSSIRINIEDQYVSRAALKLGSVAHGLKLNFKGKTVLDVGSSTGGFTDYSLRHGAAKVIAVDIGTDQMHPSLRGDSRIDLHEKTDIRDFKTSESLDIIVMDVSFISLREILPPVSRLASKKTQLVAMVKPQFEARRSKIKHQGVIKNDRLRRQVLKDFEDWVSQDFIVRDKLDSAVSGAKGNQERFYLLQKA